MVILQDWKSSTPLCSSAFTHLLPLGNSEKSLRLLKQKKKAKKAGVRVVGRSAKCFQDGQETKHLFHTLNAVGFHRENAYSRWQNEGVGVCRSSTDH